MPIELIIIFFVWLLILSLAVIRIYSYLMTIVREFANKILELENRK